MVDCNEKRRFQTDNYTQEHVGNILKVQTIIHAHLQKPKKERRLIKRTFSESSCSLTSYSTNVENKKKKKNERVS